MSAFVDQTLSQPALAIGCRCGFLEYFQPVPGAVCHDEAAPCVAVGGRLVHSGRSRVVIAQANGRSQEALPRSRHHEIASGKMLEGMIGDRAHAFRNGRILDFQTLDSREGGVALYLTVDEVVIPAIRLESPTAVPVGGVL
jgi:hypothetical protein